MENLEKIFQLVKANPGQVTIKVTHNDDPLKIAEYPFVSSDMAYITVTKGKRHTLTVIRKDGTTWSFNWGEGGYTLISDNTERLKKAVVEYIENYMHILLDWEDQRITEARIFYNNNYKLWQLTIEGQRGGKAYWWSKDATSWEEMATDVIPYVHACGWEHDIAVTGIDVWKAIL